MTLPENTLDRPPHLPRHSWRPLIMRLHFYAGVLVAPFILVAAITGGLYALAPTVERIYYGDILSVDTTGPALPLSDQVGAARTAFPELAVHSLRPAATDRESTRVYFADPSLDPELLRAVFVDPHSGRVLGDEATWLGYLPLSTWLDGLHRHLNLGEPGRIYSEVAASWLWVVALGGAYLWWVKSVRDRRRKRSTRILTVDRSMTGRSRTLNWHGASGVWLLAALLFLSATGITWSTYAGAHVTDLRSALNWQRPQLDTAPAGGEHAGHDAATTGHEHHGAPAIDYDRALAAAAGAGVHLPLELTLPAEPGEALSVTEIDKPYRWTTDAATVDPVDYTVTGQIDYWRDYSVIAKLADWGIRGHMGMLFGLLNQLLLLVVAVGLVTVIVRGYLMWWQRRPTRGSAWALGRAPIRGAIRRLHPAAAAGIIGAAVAVGWFLPLLGLTLVGFVVVDAVVGAVAARRFTPR
ncbi:PepSY domain-containing protein [Mycolicibacterium sp. F2034L]|uniref:PepSY-associated TM helix domain-containing protein n=1 Tax=Mycolicibacterium sp. F2034L TaxID=2926422 RepID=UPI001FF1BABF|nr:PepSY domain-containing protein [Mycolicibacterium sp. F2034L]MCK0177305.1 PepSY domain-containing protein [Mycolicibacterium sp. F2034L]